MKKLLFALCLALPAISNAGLITHKFEAQIFDGNWDEHLKTASITLDADPETWSLGRAWIHIDGRTVASNETRQLGKNYWHYYEPASLWKTRASFFYTFTQGDWEFAWYDIRTEIAVSADRNPIYNFLGPSESWWKWEISELVSQPSGGNLRVSSYNGYTHKVPEPHTFALFALGLAALGMRRRVI